MDDGWQVIPGMVERGRGTIIFTGSSASVTGFAGYSDLSKWPAGVPRLLLANREPTRCLLSVAEKADSWNERTRAGCGKFALRGLSQSLAREFQPAGVHIAHVIIDGVIGERRSVIKSSFLALIHSSLSIRSDSRVLRSLNEKKTSKQKYVHFCSQNYSRLPDSD